MKKLLIMGILALCLLALGCLESSQTVTFREVQQQQEAPPTQQQEAPPTQQQAGNGEEEGGISAQDLTGQGMAALILMGTPIRCTVTDPESGQISTLYIKGNSVRVEYPDPDNEGETQVMVSKQGSVKVQISAEEKSLMGGCDWLEMTSEGTPDASQTEAEAGTPSMESMEGWDPVNFNCELALFGDEKFETPGEVCSMLDMMCAGITDPQVRAQLNCP